MPHIVCHIHRDPEVLWGAFGWLPAATQAAAPLDACEVCADAILSEVYDLRADDLAENAS